MGSLVIIGATVGALVNFSLPKLWSFFNGEMKVSVDPLVRQLKFIDAFIGDHPIGGGSSNVRRVSIEELRSLAFDLQDCIERFVLYSKSSNVVDMKIKFDLEIRILKDRSKQLCEQVKLWDNTTTREPTSSAQTHVSMNKSLDELRELVCRSEMKLTVISVMGFGGVGMSTVLANRVYNDRKVREQFHHLVWVGAAGKDAEKVVEAILEQLLLKNGASTSIEVEEKWEGALTHKEIQDDGELNGVSQLKKRLRSCLENKRCLIVVDDVETEELGKIIYFLPCADGVDHRIIVTTSIQSTTKHCICGNYGDHVHNHRLLDHDDARQLFFKTHDPDEKYSTTALANSEGLAPALLSTCTADCREKGGELAVGRFQKHYNEVCGKRRTEMRYMIENSYNSLPSLLLQEMSLYFCMFPRDHPVKKNPLKRRWHAEGLLSRDMIPVGAPYTNPEDFADHQLLTLINHNVIQPIQLSNSFKVKRCQPPAMMHDCIYQESMVHNFITLVCTLGEAKQNGYTRRLSLHRNKIAAVILPHDLSRLRTLAVFPNQHLDNNYGDTLNFAEYKLLRVLDLEEWNGLNDSHFKSICNLLLLKYLSLGINIGKVPSEISKLKLLETLDLRRTKIGTVPAAVIRLSFLKHLLGKFRLDKHDCKKEMLDNLAAFLSNNCKLERLSGFLTGNRQGFPQLIRHMVILKKVKIWCDSTVDEASLTDLSNAILEFVCGGNEYRRSLAVDFKECPPNTTLPFLDRMNARGALMSLKLCGKMKKFPTFVTVLNSIQELCLSSTNLEGPVILTAAGNLTTLKCLKLIEDSLNLDEHLIEKKQFPSLLRICFLVQTRLKLPRDVEDGAMEHLVSLQLLCPDIVGTIKIGRLQRLQEVTLHAQVLDKTKNEWREAAMDHSNGLNVLFIDPPRSSSDQEPPLNVRNSTTSNL